MKLYLLVCLFFLFLFNLFSLFFLWIQLGTVRCRYNRSGEKELKKKKTSTDRQKWRIFNFNTPILFHSFFCVIEYLDCLIGVSNRFLVSVNNLKFIQWNTMLRKVHCVMPNKSKKKHCKFNMDFNTKEQRILLIDWLSFDMGHSVKIELILTTQE